MNAKLRSSIPVGFLLVSVCAITPALSRPISFEDRVAAQTAIERVYWAHRVWPADNPQPKPPLEAVVGKAALRDKVEDYLRKSSALAERWRRPITPEQLQAEVRRMAEQTRDGAMLREIFAALGDDPELIAETLARQTLAERLIRSWSSSDRGERATSFDAWWSAASLSFGIDTPPSGGSFETVTPNGSGCVDDSWTPIAMDAPDVKGSHIAVWTGSEMIVWTGGAEGSYDPSGWRYSPATDTWAPMSIVGVPNGRRDAAYAWSGSEFIVWSGLGPAGNLATGARYNPTTDTWTPMATAGAPPPRFSGKAVWTGSLFVVWGGSLSSGGRYDPATDTWTPMTTVGAPTTTSGSSTIWTGSTMIVWGGVSGFATQTNTGARYDPVADVWTPITTVGAAAARERHSTVWTGTEMIVWAGCTQDVNVCLTRNDGGRYRPSTDQWLPINPTGAPSAREGFSTVWTGTHMILWGGRTTANVFVNDGFRYNPSTDSWSLAATSGAPAPRMSHSGVWTGAEMIVWGGGNASETFQSGGRYNPSTNSWVPTYRGSMPSPRTVSSSVWTGAELIVWGGRTSANSPAVQLDTGGRYDPATHSWTPTSLTGAPAPRSGHSAIWTGSRMIVWSAGTGGRYDPVANSWTPTSTTGAPNLTVGQGAVWTGSEMIVWRNTGSRYNPTTDVWTPMGTGGSPPSTRGGFSSVWTGSLFVVWGGFDSFSNTFLATGSRYSIATNSWTATSSSLRPDARSGHSAVWTGKEMIVWGGAAFNPQFFNDGRRYDPSTDTWSLMTSTGAPSARHSAVALWTGIDMLVWGGTDNPASSAVNTGGRYNPTTDQWRPTTQVGAPFARNSVASAWAGDAMAIWSGHAATITATGALYCSCAVPMTYGPDVDGDGYGVLAGSVVLCAGTPPPPGYAANATDCNDANSAIHPGAAEICDGLDNDCNAIADDVALPSGSPLLTMQAAGTDASLSWTPLVTATGYDVVRGDLAQLRSSSGDFTPATIGCAGNDVPGNSVTVPDDPGTGGHWYLVRAVNCRGVGSYDSGASSQTGSRDAEIAASASPCP